MKQSKLFTKTQKNAPKDEVSKNARLLIQAGFIEKEMAGAYSFLPLGQRTLQKIIGVIRQEMNAIGGQEIFLTALQNPELWKKTGRWDDRTLDVWFKTTLKDGGEAGLGTTHEEPLTNLMKKHISSHKDLPVAAYQFQTKFRNEKRAKSGLMRLREFIMKDLYSFHADQADLDDYYEKVSLAYENIFRRVGLGEITYKTYASGGTFSKYSHEFQTLTEAGEDLIYICEKCRLAVNKEIIQDLEGRCPECKTADLKEEKAVETGNIFKLGTKFSKALELLYKDAQGERKEVIMGCYGIGPQRTMGAVAEILSDEKGLNWPEEIAPFQIHLLSLGENETAEKVYSGLLEKGVEVLYDDRDASAGEKFADSDLIGLPKRAVISKKSLEKGGAEIKERNREELRIIPLEKITEETKKRS